MPKELPPTIHAEKMLVRTIQSDMVPCNCFRNAFHQSGHGSQSRPHFIVRPVGGACMLLASNYLFNEQQTMQARDSGEFLQTQKPFHLFAIGFSWRIDRLRCTVKVWLQVLPYREWFVVLWGGWWWPKKTLYFEQEGSSAGVFKGRRSRCDLCQGYCNCETRPREKAILTGGLFQAFGLAQSWAHVSWVRSLNDFWKIGYNSRYQMATRIKLSLAKEAVPVEAFSLSYKSERIRDLNPSTAFFVYVCFCD